ncbi:MAG: glycosyltransferase [Gammaproteobacteria bacterium]|nr:glycosyltransferase [Gammaproteobacteria bacterium]
MSTEKFSPVDRPAGRRYCLITPCRNEAQYIRTTLETTCTQTEPPALWVIVDDGSTDETPEILQEYADRYDFIRIVQREDRGARAVGPGVIEAFYDGLSYVNLDDFDYVTKFDGDLELPPRYFERTMERMDEDPYLGNLSGKLFERLADGSFFEERTGDENAVGPVKFYRVQCFKEIGGFVREVAWDGIDGHVCRLNGWVASSVHDPEMKIVHLRPMGSSQQNIRVGRVRWGRGKYFMGSAWYYVLASAAYRSIEPPYLWGGFGILLGYFKAMLTGHPRYENPAYRRYLRRFERAQLLRGKSSALAAENARLRQGPVPGRA